MLFGFPFRRAIVPAVFMLGLGLLGGLALPARASLPRKVGPFVTDSINGYRAITRRAANSLKLDALDYTIEYQMTIRALKKKMAIVEFPTREGQRVAGETGAARFPTGLRFLRRLWAELQ